MVELTAVSEGAEHISISLPAGQTVGPIAGLPSIPVRGFIKSDGTKGA
jgi:hypothetical protein